MRIMLLIAGFIGVSLLADARNETEMTLSSSHIALVTISDVKERSGDYMIVGVNIDRSIKGSWSYPATISLRWSTTEVPLAPNGQFIVFCTEEIPRGKGVVYYSEASELISVSGNTDDAYKRIADIAEEQHRRLAILLRSDAGKAPEKWHAEVDRLLAALFVANERTGTIRELIALPTEANRALVSHVYDLRPIPQGLLSPDEPIKFHQSAVADCRNIQEVVIWILGLRGKQGFGTPSNSNTLARRMAIADAWYYWINRAEQRKRRFE